MLFPRLEIRHIHVGDVESLPAAPTGYKQEPEDRPTFASAGRRAVAAPQGAILAEPEIVHAQRVTVWTGDFVQIGEPVSARKHAIPESNGLRSGQWE
jgi:hypothetical protein